MEADLDALHKQRLATAFERLRKKAGFDTKTAFYMAINQHLGTGYTDPQFSRWLSPLADEDHPQPRAIILLAAYELAGVQVLEPTEQEELLASLVRTVDGLARKVATLEASATETL